MPTSEATGLVAAELPSERCQTPFQQRIPAFQRSIHENHIYLSAEGATDGVAPTNSSNKIFRIDRIYVICNYVYWELQFGLVCASWHSFLANDGKMKQQVTATDGAKARFIKASSWLPRTRKTRFGKAILRAKRTPITCGAQTGTKGSPHDNDKRCLQLVCSSIDKVAIEDKAWPRLRWKAKGVEENEQITELAMNIAWESESVSLFFNVFHYSTLFSFNALHRL